MRLITTMAAAAVLITCSAFADEPVNGLSPDYKEKIIRLGDKVMRVGTIQAGPAAVANQALMQIPEDDSHKFHISILISDNAAFKPGCDALLQAFSTSEQLLALVNLDDLRKSWFLPQVRKFEDISQKHWIDPLREFLFPTDKSGKAVPILDASGHHVSPFPAIVIKPPLDGSYGDNEEVVTIIFGFNGDVKSTYQRIQNAVDVWMQTHDQGGQARAASENIEAARPSNQWPDPFTKAVPMPPVGEFDPASQAQWPAKRFNKPSPLTAKQIKELVPDAPQSFRLSMLEEEVSEPTAVKEAWLKHREDLLTQAVRKHQEQSKPVEQPTAEVTIDPEAKSDDEVNPPQPVPTISTPETQSSQVNSLDVLGIIILTAAITMGGMYLYQRNQVKPTGPLTV